MTMNLDSLGSKFITQDTIDEKRQTRQEEWEKVRTASDPVEVPEEIVDNRTLFQQLQDHKQKKDDDYEEQFKLSNRVRGLDEDESKFLDFVSNRQEELMKNRRNEDAAVIDEYKVAMQSQVVKIDDKPSKQVVKSDKKINTDSKPTRRSQQALLGMAVKRKSSDTSTKETKQAEKSQTTDSLDTTSPTATTNLISTSTVDSTSKSQQPAPSQCNIETGATATVIGILPGLGAYSGSSDSVDSSDDSSSDDASLGLGLLSKRRKCAHVHVQGHPHAH